MTEERAGWRVPGWLIPEGSVGVQRMENEVPGWTGLWRELEVLGKWWIMDACVHGSHFNHVGLFVTPWTVAHQASLSMGILQARILEEVAIPFSRGSSWPRDWTAFPWLLHCRQILYHWATGEAWIMDVAAAANALQSCLTLCDPIDGSPPGSPVKNRCNWNSVYSSELWPGTIPEGFEIFL